VASAVAGRASAAVPALVPARLVRVVRQVPAPEDSVAVPAVLVGGDHAAIRRWRLREALGRTWLKRPRLLAERALSPEESELLAEFKGERNA